VLFTWWKDLVRIWNEVGLEVESWFEDNLRQKLGKGACIYSFLG